MENPLLFTGLVALVSCLALDIMDFRNSGLFEIIANLYFKESDILVSREVDLGRGSVDFYLSIGKKNRALVELKLGNHQGYEKGINYQLPTYLKVEGVDLGIFILICFSDNEYKKAEKMFENAKELSVEYEKDIRFERINASGKYKSASKIKNKAEMNLESC